MIVVCAFGASSSNRQHQQHICTSNNSAAHSYTASSIARGALSSSSTEGQCTRAALPYKNRGTAIFQTHSTHSQDIAEDSVFYAMVPKTPEQRMLLQSLSLLWRRSGCQEGSCQQKALPKDSQPLCHCLPLTSPCPAGCILVTLLLSQGQLGPGSAPELPPHFWFSPNAGTLSLAQKIRPFLVSLYLKLLHVLPPSLLFLIDQPIFIFSLTASILKTT